MVGKLNWLKTVTRKGCVFYTTQHLELAIVA